MAPDQTKDKCPPGSHLSQYPEWWPSFWVLLAERLPWPPSSSFLLGKSCRAVVPTHPLVPAPWRSCSGHPLCATQTGCRKLHSHVWRLREAAGKVGSCFPWDFFFSEHDKAESSNGLSDLTGQWMAAVGAIFQKVNWAYVIQSVEGTVYT